MASLLAQRGGRWLVIAGLLLAIAPGAPLLAQEHTSGSALPRSSIANWTVNSTVNSRVGSVGSPSATAAVLTPAAPVEIDAPEPQPSSMSAAAMQDSAPDLPPVAAQSDSASGAPSHASDVATAARVEPMDVKYIQPGRIAQPLTERAKLLIGSEDTYRLINFGGIVVAAGYEQLTNGAPNYGTDKSAFGERLGAAAIRDTSQGIFTDAVFATLLHEDPRYYVEGPRYSIVHRALYAITRPLITRTDSGRSTVNGALLLGYASSALLDSAYYPSINRNVRDTASAFGGSIGGAALGFALGEFTSGLWHKVHFGRR